MDDLYSRDEVVMMLERMAEEQKSIDEDAIHAIVEEQVLKAINEQKTIDIDKAIMAHCECCTAYDACKSRGKFSCHETGKIRKAMEE